MTQSLLAHLVGPIRGRRPGHRHRRGFSLFEVLIAVFVLLVGLLSVIMLVTAGVFRMSQALQADRAASVAQCALEDLQAHDMLNSDHWVYPTQSGTTLVQDALPSCTAYAIDPYFIGTVGSSSDSTDIAAFGGNQCNQFPYSNITGVRMPRLTFASSLTSNAWAKRVFVSHDDLLVDTSDDPSIRPRLAFVTTSGSFTVDPAQAAAREVQGEYSWMATVEPDASDPLHKTFSVSVAVFRNRDLSLPVAGKAIEEEKYGERVVNVSMAASFGAVVGAVTIAKPSSVTTSTEDYLATVAGDWMLLCYDNTSLVPGQKIFRWYRIVAASDVDPIAKSRDLTLAGPDWSWNNTNVYGVLFTRLIAVRTETVGVP